MAHGARRRRWWSDVRQKDGWVTHRAEAVGLMHEGMRRRWKDALAICGPREWVAPRCWMRVSEDRVKVGRLLTVAEAYAFERHGPAWGTIRGGVAHHESGMLSAVARAWILQAGLESTIMFPRMTYYRLRRMVPILLEPAQPWLVRYSWRAAREWERLRVKGEKEAARGKMMD